MTFWEHFLRLLPRRPVPALAALYWYVTRRRVRARNRLKVATMDLPFAYKVWIKRNEDKKALKTAATQAISQWRSLPSFGILLHAPATYTDEETDLSVRSIERQIYASWTLLNQRPTNLREALAHANCDYVVPLRIGDILSEAALFRLAEAVQSNPTAGIIYGDEDRLDDHGERSCPWFKPEWNREMFLAQDYLSAALAIKTELARSAGDVNALNELLLETTSQDQTVIAHVPHVLCHVTRRADETGQWLSAVARHVEAKNATCTPGPFGTVKVSWPLPSGLPLVSIIVPTRDKLHLLRPCLDGILSKTDYENFEVLVLDNDSVEERTLGYLSDVSQDLRVRVVRFSGEYNFSSFNNFAAQQARGSYLCLLNNDTEVITSAWLTEMMRHAVQPEVGAVGAKLLYDDGTIQHAGVVIGLGDAAGHAHRFLPAHEPGYFRMAHITQYVSAVTAACLVVEKRKFDAVGGLDEQLAVAFNDVDFCLKLEAAGWRNVYVPHAILVHHESRSRGKDITPQNLPRYLRELGMLQERWRTRTYKDPLHNPNLDRATETFVVKI